MKAEQPKGVYQGADGRFVRAVTVGEGQDGPIVDIRGVCEDCWRDIPRYVDFPTGLVSPEAVKDAKGNPREKVICRECYIDAQTRISPDADLSTLSDRVHGAPQSANG